MKRVVVLFALFTMGNEGRKVKTYRPPSGHWGGAHGTAQRGEDRGSGLTSTNLNCYYHPTPLSSTSLHGGWNFLNKQAHESFLYGKEKSVLPQPSF